MRLWTISRRIWENSMIIPSCVTVSTRRSFRQSHRFSRDVQSKILQRIYNRSTAEEQRWIVRIILKGRPASIPTLQLCDEHDFALNRHGDLSQRDDCIFSIPSRCAGPIQYVFRPEESLLGAVGPLTAVEGRGEKLDKTRYFAAQIAVVGQNSSAFSCICTYAV
jgi:hypothetical protein